MVSGRREQAHSDLLPSAMRTAMSLPLTRTTTARALDSAPDTSKITVLLIFIMLQSVGMITPC